MCNHKSNVYHDNLGRRLAKTRRASVGRRHPGCAALILALVMPQFAFAAADGAGKPLTVRKSRATGLATFVTARDGGPIPVPVATGKRAVEPLDFLVAHGRLFGVTDPAGQLKVEKAHVGSIGRTHTTYQQVHNGIPVFSGILKVHQDPGGAVVVANGDFYPGAAKVDTRPKLQVDAAIAIAERTLEHAQPVVEHAELVIVDPGWYGNPPLGAHLAYHIILADLSVPLREAFFVDAHTGKILDQWNLVHTALYRMVWDDSQAMWVRFEGDPPTGDPDSDAAYDYTGDTYDYFFRAFGRDSYDNAGSDMGVTVHSLSSSCPNAWGGVVAHEWGHSITSWTAGLMYRNQAGQLNESYSDIWGEMIDLLNGDVADPGPPSGPPYWPTPTGYVGPGTDTPNTLRSAGVCVSGVALDINAPPSIAGTYLAGPARFGPALDETGVTGDVVLAEPVLACEPITNPGAVNGKIALVDRGDCYFSVKVKNAQDAGAIAVMVANNIPGPPMTLGGSDPTVTIPSVGITQADGDLIESTLETDTVNVTVRANSSAGGVRWLTGEDATGFGGAIRDMWEPTCYGDPDRAYHPFQTCNPSDNGGVHSGSGIPNHAFAIASDGKTFNGYTVTGIGIIKAGTVWYHALTTYLTTVSDFEDANWALNQAAADLTNTMIKDPRDGSDYGLFTADDAIEVGKALLATEMNTEGLCGASGNVVDPEPPDRCPDSSTVYFDDFESDVTGWSVSNTGPSGPPTPYDWEWIIGGLPFGRPGNAWFCEDRSVGNCSTQDESAVHSLFSPVIALPADLPSPTLAFTQYLDAEWGYDGGNVRIRVDGGEWQLVPGSAFTYNAYNDVLISAAAGNTNPMAGEEAWTGFSMLGGGWGTSLIDLRGYVSGGENVEFRFDFGKDGCGGWLGWYVDDVEVYTCSQIVVPVTAAEDWNSTTTNLIGSSTCTSGPCPNTSTCIDEICYFTYNRYLYFHPNNAGQSVALRVRHVASGETRWVDWVDPATQQVVHNNNAPDMLTYMFTLPDGSPPDYAVWPQEPIAVTGCFIVPGEEYEIQVLAQGSDPGNEGNYTAALTLPTAIFGDAISTLTPPGPDAFAYPPQGPLVDVMDMTAVVEGFSNANWTSKLYCDLIGLIDDPSNNNIVVDVSDMTVVVDAFGGGVYPGMTPDHCP
jgi:Zn-dependent metalloprotease